MKAIPNFVISPRSRRGISKDLFLKAIPNPEGVHVAELWISKDLFLKAIPNLANEIHHNSFTIFKERFSSTKIDKIFQSIAAKTNN